jgi:hypothetical protein
MFVGVKMSLFAKLDYYIDYNNQYSLKKALTTLGREFNLAVSKKNIWHARETIKAVRQVYDKLSQTYRESEDYGETMSYSQKLIAQQMRKFIAYLTHRMKSEFGISDYEQEIEQAIS